MRLSMETRNSVPVPVTKKFIYSRDRNLWHIIHEGDILEDPANEPKKDMLVMCADPEDAPNTPEYVEIGIEAGYPVSLNGKVLSWATLLEELNEIGGHHGIGRVDMVENRLAGMKSRAVYETPGGTMLTVAVRALGSLTLDRETMEVKDSLALKHVELVYAWRWFDPLRESMDAVVEKITATTSGSVTWKLYKKILTIASQAIPNSLYMQDISSSEEGGGSIIKQMLLNLFDSMGCQQESGLFCSRALRRKMHILGMPSKPDLALMASRLSWNDSRSVASLWKLSRISSRSYVWPVCLVHITRPQCCV